MKKWFSMSWRAKRSHLKGGVLSNETASSLSLLAMTLLLGLLFGMVSCKKSSGLSGAAPVAPGNVSSSTSASGTSTGTVMGGLTPVSGATVSLFQAGTNTAIATTTTNAQGSFNLPFTGASGLLYYKVTGGTPLGNPGGTSNSNIQLIGLVGSSSALPTGTIQINELTTAAFMTVAKLMGIVTDTGGTVTFSAPNSTVTTNNIVAQFNNLITNGQYASGLSTAQQQSLGTVANAIAGCVENSSGCSTLMSTATNPSGGGASSSILDAAVNMLNTSSSTTIGSVYTLAQKSAPTTGFTLSGSAPSVLSTPLAATVNTYPVGGTGGVLGPPARDKSGNIWIANRGGSGATVNELSSTGGSLGSFSGLGGNPQTLAIDSSGNVWVDILNNGTLVELTPSGSVAGTFGVGSSPQGIAIDSANNIWVANTGVSTVTELNNAGTLQGTFTVGTNPLGIAFDSSSNAWIANTASGNVTELNSSGTTLGTFTVSSTTLTFVTVDASGNIWVGSQSASNNIFELSSSGTVLNTFSSPKRPNGIAIDALGNIWIAIYNNSVSPNTGEVVEMNTSGVVVDSFTPGKLNFGIVIDPSGNVWSANQNDNTVSEMIGVTAGPRFYPYSGPAFPSPL